MKRFMVEGTGVLNGEVEWTNVTFAKSTDKALIDSRIALEKHRGKLVAAQISLEAWEQEAFEGPDFIKVDNHFPLCYNVYTQLGNRMNKMTKEQAYIELEKAQHDLDEIRDAYDNETNPAMLSDIDEAMVEARDTLIEALEVYDNE